MQFITDNYIWFIVGGIVILMTIIGYIADKTDFGRKNAERKEKLPKEKKEKVKKEKPVKQAEKIEVDAKGIGELTQSMAESFEEPEKQVEVATEEDLYAPLQPLEVPKEEPVDETLYAPLENTNVEVTPVASEEMPLESVPVNEVEVPTVEEVQLQPLQPVTIEEAIEEPMAEVNEEVSLEPELHNVEPAEMPVEITEEPTSEEDIWKF